MTPESEFTSYADHLKAGDHPFLGRLAWYSVSDVLVNYEELSRNMIAAGLSGHLKKPPGDPDVFRRVCTASQRKRVATDVAAVFANYLLRDVGRDPKRVYKRIVRETVDTAGKRLGYIELMDVEFDKNDGRVVIQAKTQDMDRTAVEIAAGIEESYQQERGCMNSYAVREVFRKVLLGVNATNVRGASGGLYFVNEKYVDTVASLEKLADTMGDTCQVHSLPLIDDAKQRDMLRKAFESESVDEIQFQLDQIIELKANLAKTGRKLTADKFSEILGTFRDLQDKSREYSGLLDVSLSTTKSQLSIFKRSIMDLGAMVDDGTEDPEPGVTP